MKTKTTRRIKVYQQYRSLSYGTRMVPELRLSGVWMEQLGFKIGETVNITTRDRLLIIEPVEAQTNYKAALQEVKQALKKLSQ